MPTNRVDDPDAMSLAPLDPEGALRALLAVRPEEEPQSSEFETAEGR